MTDTGVPVLCVCWEPPVDRLHNGTILSFLSADDEDAIAGLGSRIINGREASLPFRAVAMDLYVLLVARLGIAERAGRTLRSTLHFEGDGSCWWYHPVALKDCESDPTFEYLIAFLTIADICDRHAVGRVDLVGVPEPLADLLTTHFDVGRRTIGTRRSTARGVMRAIASRVKYCVMKCSHLRALGPDDNPLRADVALSGFWNWSVWCEEGAAALQDRYFKTLPQELVARGLSVMWLASYSPDGNAAAAAPRTTPPQVHLLERHLRATDVIRSALDFRPLFHYWSFLRNGAITAALTIDGVDYTALFSARLTEGFVGASIVHHRLVEMSTRRAVDRLRPKILVTFLEHLLHARATYAGASGGPARPTLVTVQHASNNSEKSFVYFHPDIDFGGAHDGYRFPAPDYVCAMGPFAEGLYRKCGYPAERVLTTGSPRYDYLGSVRTLSDRIPHRSGTLNVLVACSLPRDSELEMVRAVHAAASSCPGVSVVAREHPFRRLRDDEGLADIAGSLTFSDRTVFDDLDWADLVIFTSSTLAEEAVVQGRAVWQWLLTGPNSSALAEAFPIPRFASVRRLRDALATACHSGLSPQSSISTAAVAGTLFAGADGRAAARVADALRTIAQRAADAPDPQPLRTSQAAHVS